MKTIAIFTTLIIITKMAFVPQLEKRINTLADVNSSAQKVMMFINK